MTAPFVKECLPILRRTPATLDAMLRDLPERWTNATEGDGTWSPYIVIGHLIHCEREDWMPRLDIILKHGPTKVFEPFEREGHVRYTAGKPLSALLDEFANVRRENLSTLEALNLDIAQLESLGTHPAFGPVSVHQLLATWTAHDLAHILQISRIMAKRLKPDVGPWAEYMSVMK